MATIEEMINKYFSKIDYLDLELIISCVLKKPREFVLTHPEYKIPKFKIKNLKLKISRRRRGEPLAYILGHKEFYGLDFKVSKNVLVPRPETELLVDLAINDLRLTTNDRRQKSAIIDVGTGSGNIIVSIASNMKHVTCNKIKFYGIDISEKALKVARENAKKHKLDKKIKFLKGNLLEPIMKNKYLIHDTRYMILANLPYVSKKIYAKSPTIKHEPKISLLSPAEGLGHYEKILKQLEKLSQVTGYRLRITGFFEFSPEQKLKIQKMIKSYFPKAKIKFHKDLSGKWRVCEIII